MNFVQEQARDSLELIAKELNGHWEPKMYERKWYPRRTRSNGKNGVVVDYCLSINRTSIPKFRSKSLCLEAIKRMGVELDYCI